jgi:hypothetical protein
VNRKKVLDIKCVRIDHVPGAGSIKTAGINRTIVLRKFVYEEGKRERWFGPIEEIDRTVTLLAGKDLLDRKIGSTRGARNLSAATVAAVFPAMERTLNAAADNLTESEVCPQMTAGCIHHDCFSIRIPVTNHPAIENRSREGSSVDVATGAQPVPGCRKRRKVRYPRCPQFF